MAAIGHYNNLLITKHTGFGLYLDGGPHGEILLPNRYIPTDVPADVGDWLRVFIYRDSEDKLIATTERPKVTVGQFASLKVAEINHVGLFLDWGLPKDLLLPHSEEKRPLQVGDYCVVYVYLDKHTERLTATARLDRFLDKTPANYQVGEAVDLLVVEPTDLGFNAIINNQHWALIHRNELFRPVHIGERGQGFIREVRADGKINLSLQPVGPRGGDQLQDLIMQTLDEHGGVLRVSDKSAAPEISRLFGVSKGNFKKAIGGLYRQGRIVIHPDRIESSS